MTAPAQPVNFSTANPHALAVILEASETKSIIASHDIFDVSGTKLWARDMPVSQALQRKLMDRQLRQPLETCLLAEDGVTAHSLVEGLEALLANSSPLSPLLRPHAAKLLREAPFLPLHSVAQLLLTAGQAARPDSFEHAVQAMALNGALALAQGGNTQDLRLAMVCGLLHDLGEMYIAPQFGEADADGALDFQSYKHLVVHPHVGQLLLAQLTNYPSAIARAIAEHHERLDGSGYPNCLLAEQLSPMGKRLAATEAVLAVLRSDSPHLARASVALRVVPGEFDLLWAGAISHAARMEPPLQASQSSDEIQARLSLLETVLQSAQSAVDALHAAAQSPAMGEALALAQHHLTRLRKGWNASGLWGSSAVDELNAGEVEAVEQELMYRLRAIHRAALLHAEALSPKEVQSLQVLGTHLGG